MDKRKLHLLFGGVKKTTVLINTVEDTRVRTTAATTNYSAATTFLVRRTVNNGIIKYDLSSIPAAAKIISAKMILTVTGSQDATISAYSIKSANSDMVFAQMTYNEKKTGTEWAGGALGCGVSGTDYDAVAVGSIALLSATTVPYSAEIELSPAIIQSYLVNNYGFLMLSSYDGGDVTFSSAQGDAGLVPKIEVIYK